MEMWVGLTAPRGLGEKWVRSKGRELGKIVSEDYWERREEDRAQLAAGGVLKECGCGIKVGGAWGAKVLVRVSPGVFSLLIYSPSTKVLGTERGQGHLVDHTHPYPHDHLGTVGPTSSRSSSGFSHLGKSGAILCTPEWNQAGSASLSPRRLISSSLSAFLASSCPS